MPVEELVERHRAPAALEAPTPLPSLPDHKRRPVSWLVAHVVAQQEAEAAFTPAKIAREVNQHFGSQLRRPLDGRAASVTLRRLAASGRLHLLREGTPHHEALYSRRRPVGSA